MNRDRMISQKPPLWLLAEITYRCPLQCPYCSNPTDFATQKDELDTEEWLRVLHEGRKMGALQLGFSGGEPLARQDLEILISEGHKLGYYTNLITSTMGMNEERVAGFKECGLDNIQISFQASEQDVNDFLAGTNAHQHKVEMARAVKKYGFSLVFNIVIHKLNIDHMKEILDLAIDLDADYIELANAQYYGFAFVNRAQLLPTKEQLDKAHKVAKTYQERYHGKKEIYYIIPDYYETRPKPCMNGWGSVFLTVTPNGIVLPCHSARVIKDLEFPNVRDHSLQWIWEESPGFNAFRGYNWMKEPCRSCPEKTKDFGGCRCQAYLLTQDARTADPVCDLSPHHQLVLDALKEAKHAPTIEEHPLVFRNPKNSKRLKNFH